jgi:NitT/TauT family transport system permease protein
MSGRQTILSIPARLFAIRGTVPSSTAVILGLIPILALFGIWWWITSGDSVEDRIISVTILPSPAEVWANIGPLFTRVDDNGGNALWHHLLSSLRRVGVGFVIALAVTLPLGIAMGAFGHIRAMFTPLVTASGYIPIATLVPLTMSWFGTDEKQKYLFLAIAFGIYLLPLIVKAIDGVPEIYLRTAATLGASRRQIVMNVMVPSALPDLWHAMRLAFGVGWTFIVLTEALVMTNGLGFLVVTGFRRGPREQIYIVIIIITAVAWLADLGWERLGRLLFPYRRTR